jgi:hypothetical protein
MPLGNSPVAEPLVKTQAEVLEGYIGELLNSEKARESF